MKALERTSKRPLNKRELQLASNEPLMPTWLGRGARKIWAELTRQLLIAGTLKELDQIQLAHLCDVAESIVEAKRAIRRDKKPLVVSSPSGRKHINPLRRYLSEQILIFDRLANGFGLSPAARGRIHSMDDVPPSAEPGKTLEQLIAPGPAEAEGPDDEVTLIQ